MPVFPLPIRGVSDGMFEGSPLPSTSGHINNIRVKDVLEGKLRISQREGLDKAFSQQVGGAARPIVLLATITTVD